MFNRSMELMCPLLKRNCIREKCKFWTHLRGANPQTGEEIDKHGCAIEFIPLLLVENSRQQYSTGAAVESFRNEMVKSNSSNIEILAALIDNSTSPPALPLACHLAGSPAGHPMLTSGHNISG